MSDIKLSSKAQSLKNGVYMHYKGNKYLVLGVVIHSETLEELVLYKALYGEGLNWVRPLEMFLENVETSSQVLPRFRFIGKKTK